MGHQCLGMFMFLGQIDCCCSVVLIAILGNGTVETSRLV